jgi:hypothetical protein
MRNHFLLTSDEQDDQAATNDFNTMRENILFYDIHFPDQDPHIRVESNARDAARVRLERNHAWLIVNQQWCYPGLEWGNYTGRRVQLRPGENGSISLHLLK